MLKGAMLTGKPVLAYNTNQEIGHVQGILIDYDAGSLAAFWVNFDAAPHQKKVLPWSGVKTVEPDRVVAWSANMLANERDLFSIRRLIRQKAIRPGMRFRTLDHRDLGAMVDFFVNERMGRLEGYEIVGGLFGKSADDFGFLPAVHILSITEDAVLVPSSIIQVMQEKPGGLSELLERLNEEFSPNAPITEDVLIHRLLPLIDRLRVRRTIQLDNGVILAARGQIVTAALIQRALALEAEQQLIEAMGIDLGALLHRVDGLR